MNIMLGLLLLACLKISLTFFAPVPTNISTYSAEQVFMKLTPLIFDKH